MLSYLLAKLRKSKTYKPPFQVKRLSLGEIQLHSHHLAGLGSLQLSQLEALAQLTRMIATLTRSDEKAEGVVLLWSHIEQLHNKHNAKKKADREALKEKAMAETEPKAKSWKEMLIDVMTH